MMTVKETLLMGWTEDLLKMTAKEYLSQLDVKDLKCFPNPRDCGRTWEVTGTLLYFGDGPLTETLYGLGGNEEEAWEDALFFYFDEKNK